MQTSAANLSAPQTVVDANNLIEVFNQYADKINILSLDCFDTILWRNVVEPTDVFYELQEQATFKALGMNALLRRQAETAAAKMNRVQKGSRQVKLSDIYRMSFPEISETDLEALITEELAAEQAACFAFPPMLDLMRHAIKLGKQLIIVSDTYLTETQLRELLASKLPSDIMQGIKHIFASCEYNAGKAEGLFKIILKQLNIQAKKILHIGDNRIADCDAPNISNINTLLFKHYDENIYELVRMQAAASGFLDPNIRNKRGLYNPYLGLLAMQKNLNDPAAIIGYASIGPIMYAFARYIIDEIKSLKAKGKNTKTVFLLRDAYLPYLAVKALDPSCEGELVRISRFTAYAASFRTKRDVQVYIAQTAQSSLLNTMCKQLLLPKSLANQIVKQANASKKPIDSFIELITQDHVLKIVFENAKLYRARFRKYLEKTTGLKAGDTLIFVDLGYSGTAQTKLSPVIADEWQVDVIGRYLIAARTPNWSQHKAGLIDPVSFDDKALAILITYIGLFEKICANSDPSVIDFAENGDPIYEEDNFSGEQYNTIRSIQNETVRFVTEVENYFATIAQTPKSSVLRDVAAISLSRLIFLPSKAELDFMQNLQFDFNLGTNEVMPVFDIDKGITNLRRRSWLHSIKENLENMRTNYPAEWRAANLELALTLMAQHRFEFKFTLDDLSQRKEAIPTLYIVDNDVSAITINATPTHDGYYALQVPILQSNHNIGIQFGHSLKWVEIESAEIVELGALYTENESKHSSDASPYLGLANITCHDQLLFQCNEDGMLIFAAQNKFSDSFYVLRVIFRPILRR